MTRYRRTAAAVTAAGVPRGSACPLSVPCLNPRYLRTIPGTQACGPGARKRRFAGVSESWVPQIYCLPCRRSRVRIPSAALGKAKCAGFPGISRNAGARLRAESRSHFATFPGVMARDGPGVAIIPSPAVGVGSRGGQRRRGLPGAPRRDRIAKHRDRPDRREEAHHRLGQHLHRQSRRRGVRHDPDRHRR